MKMTPSSVDVDYIICECGIDFLDIEDLQEHILCKHIKRESIIDDGSADFYLLEVDKTNDKDDARNINAEELQVVETLGECCEITVDSNESQEVFGSFQYNVSKNKNEIENCSIINIEPNNLHHIEISSETVEDVEKTKIEAYHGISMLSSNHDLRTVNYNLVNGVTNDGNTVMFFDKGSNEICHSQSTIKTEENTNSELTLEQKPSEQLIYCELCKKVYWDERLYQAHFRKVHLQYVSKNKKTERENICDICGRDYATKTSLKTHQKIHSGTKPHKCSICGRCFSMKVNLQIHMRIHTDERPYQCELCPKAFRNKAAINRHSLVHTGIKPYPCPECGRSFSQSNSMKWHIRTVHWNEPWPYKKKKLNSDKLRS